MRGLRWPLASTFGSTSCTFSPGPLTTSTARWQKASSCGVESVEKYGAPAMRLAWRRTVAFRVSANSSRSCVRPTTATTPPRGALSERHSSRRSSPPLTVDIRQSTEPVGWSTSSGGSALGAAPFSPAVAHMTGSSDSISTRNSVDRVVEYSPCELNTGTIVAPAASCSRWSFGSSAVANVRASTGGSAPSHSATP